MKIKPESVFVFAALKPPFKPKETSCACTVITENINNVPNTNKRFICINFVIPITRFVPNGII